MNKYETVKISNATNGSILDSMTTPVKYKYRSVIIDAPEGLVYGSGPDDNGDFKLMFSVDKELEPIRINLVKADKKENVVITGIPAKLTNKLSISLVKIPIE